MWKIKMTMNNKIPENIKSFRSINGTVNAGGSLLVKEFKMKLAILLIKFEQVEKRVVDS